MLLGLVRVRAELRFQLRLFASLLVWGAVVLFGTLVSIDRRTLRLLLLAFFFLLCFAFLQPLLYLVQVCGTLDVYWG